MRDLAAKIAICLCLLGTGADAQDRELLLQMQNNPKLLQQDPDLLDKLNKGSKTQKSQNGRDGVPSAKASNAPNADDLANNSDILIQSKARTKEAGLSILQRYFSILSGEILPIYGAVEFSQQQNDELLFFNTTGRDYRLAAGDIVRVTLRGLTELDSSLKVSQDGELVIKNLLPINVNGKTIAQTEAQITSILKLDDASASAFLSLTTARLVTIQVSGGVRSPRTIAVPAYTPISRVMSYIGGISNTGSLRNIVLRHQDGTVDRIDFYDFLQNPFGSNDPIIKDSARIFIGKKGATIGASGYVARPGIYELPLNVTTIPVRDLLELTGTALIPPGAVLEVLSFDTSGIAQSFTTTIDKNIKQGETLRLRFIETRNLANISVEGSVLEAFDVASSTPLPVRDVLKNGTVFRKDTLLGFSLITDSEGETRAINLVEALKNDTIKISPGSTLHIFNQDSFNELVRADPNKPENALVAKLSQTDVAEIFLNNQRIAFLPPSTTKSFKDLLRPFYRFTPQTVLEFALVLDVQGGYKTALAVSPGQIFQQGGSFDLKPGTKIFLFERAFYNRLLSHTETLYDTQNDTQNQNLEADFTIIDQAINKANLAQVFLDGSLFALLPTEQPTILKNILATLGGLPVSISRDLVILSFSGLNKPAEAYTLNSLPRTRFVGDIRLDMFTDTGLRALIAEIDSGRDDALAAKIKLYAHKMFIDGKMVAAFGNFEKLSDTSFSKILRQDPTIYPLFSTISEYSSLSGFWNTTTFTVKQMLGQSFGIIGAARFDLLTKPFVQSLLNKTTESGLLVQFAGDIDATDDDAVTEDKLPSVKQQSLLPQKRLPPFLSLKALQNASHFVGGGVERPGSYPTAEKITLAQLIAIAGGFTPGADLKNILIQNYTEQEGKLSTDDLKSVNAAKVDLASLELSGQYSVNVQSFINNAFSGTIVLSGEINRPGEYIFARTETLHDVLDRASGLSEAAYPLGAVFERLSAKEQQKNSNGILANQLEQSVLQLSSSDSNGAGEQINAVLGFANKLKQQEPMGRLSVNVLMRDKSVPIFLEDGDRLIVPKRPSHISIIGSVNQSVRAQYSPKKIYKDYILNAGGYSVVADIKRSYLLLPNGEATPLTKDTIIPPGSVIVVPPRTDKLSVLGLTDLLSRVLGNIATSILAINNVK